MDTNSCIIRGGTVVCADRVLPDCDVVVIDGRIAAIEPVGASDFDAQPDATMGVLPVVDARGAYVVPGLIDIHSDYVENVASPRPSVVMDLSTSPVSYTHLDVYKRQPTARSWLRRSSP